MFGLSMQQLADVCEVDEGGLFSSDSDDLRRFHNKLPLLTSHHVGVLQTHDVDDPDQQLFISVVSLRACPGRTGGGTEGDVVSIPPLILLLTILFVLCVLILQEVDSLGLLLLLRKHQLIVIQTF